MKVPYVAGAALALTIAASVSVWPRVQQRPSYIRLDCGGLFDAHKAVVEGDRSIFVRSGKIVDIQSWGESSSQVQGAGEMIDLRDRICLPGLIDTHVHFEQSFPDINFFHHPDEARTVMDAYDAPRRTL
ncbi:MAG: hypothetical protein AB7P49_06175, partial [Bdellovibrionales bacterium]